MKKKKSTEASFLVYFEIYGICRIQQHLFCGRDNESAHNSQCMKPEKSIIIEIWGTCSSRPPRVSLHWFVISPNPLSSTLSTSSPIKTPDPQAPALSAFLVENDEITENAEGDPDAPEPAAEETSKWNSHLTGFTTNYRSSNKMTCETAVVWALFDKQAPVQSCGCWIKGILLYQVEIS